LQAVPFGFITIPVYTYMEKGKEQVDDVSINNCDSVYQNFTINKKLDTTYENYIYLRDDLRSVYQK
jgi:hypothetical protein